MQGADLMAGRPRPVLPPPQPSPREREAPPLPYKCCACRRCYGSGDASGLRLARDNAPRDAEALRAAVEAPMNYVANRVGIGTAVIMLTLLFACLRNAALNRSCLPWTEAFPFPVSHAAALVLGRYAAVELSPCAS